METVTRNRPGQVATRQLARFDEPTGPVSRLAVVSDAHLTETGHGTLKMLHRTKQRLRTAVGDTRRLGVDGVVVAGDLTADGTDAEYRLADRLLGAATSPQVVLPGNHDVGPSRGEPPAPDEVASRYGHEGYPVGTTVGGLSVLGLDSTVPGRIHGRVDPDTLRAEADSLAEQPTVAVLHHPVAPLPESFRGLVGRSTHRIRQPAAVADALTAAGVELVVSGHLHWPFVTRYRGLFVVGAPSTASFPPSYLLIETDPEGTTVSLVPLAGPEGVREAYEFAIEDELRGEAIERVVSDTDHDGIPAAQPTEKH
jgi:3',5'-cyclic AMP phosphodiesterase CpdA